MDPYTANLERRVAALERHVARLERRLAQDVAFARSTAPPDDTGNVQTIQGRLDALSTRDGMPVLFHYGFSSAMPVGGDKVVLFGNGDRSNGVVIASGHQQYRYKGLKTGEVCLYDMWGHVIQLTQSGIAVTGDLHVSGAMIAGYGGGDQVNLQTHRHGTGTAAAGTVLPTPGA